MTVSDVILRAGPLRLRVNGSVGTLDGRVALVTGALGRLGPIWCAALRGAGAKVYGLDMQPGADFRCDITDPDAVLNVTARVGAPDILVNNAGIDAPPGSHRSDSLEVFRVNAVGTLTMLQFVGIEMALRGQGSIINIGSLYSAVSPDQRVYRGWVKPACYGASKAAIHAMTQYYAAMWAGRGVRVNTLSPGGVLGEQPEDFQAAYCARVPMGRMAEPADLAGPLLFLASDASCYVTGINLLVDGGYTAW